MGNTFDDQSTARIARSVKVTEGLATGNRPRPEPRGRAPLPRRTIVGEITRAIPAQRWGWLYPLTWDATVQKRHFEAQGPEHVVDDGLVAYNTNAVPPVEVFNPFDDLIARTELPDGPGHGRLLGTAVYVHTFGHVLVSPTPIANWVHGSLLNAFAFDDEPAENTLVFAADDHTSYGIASIISFNGNPRALRVNDISGHFRFHFATGVSGPPGANGRLTLRFFDKEDQERKGTFFGQFFQLADWQILGGETCDYSNCVELDNVKRPIAHPSFEIHHDMRDGDYVAITLDALQGASLEEITLNGTTLSMQRIGPLFTEDPLDH